MDPRRPERARLLRDLCAAAAGVPLVTYGSKGWDPWWTRESPVRFAVAPPPAARRTRQWERALADAARDHAPLEQRSRQSRHEAGEIDRGAYRSDNSDGAREPKRHGKVREENRAKSGRPPDFEKKNKHPTKPAYAGQQQLATAAHEKRKLKKKRRG